MKTLFPWMSMNWLGWSNKRTQFCAVSCPMHLLQTVHASCVTVTVEIAPDGRSCKMGLSNRSPGPELSHISFHCAVTGIPGPATRHVFSQMQCASPSVSAAGERTLSECFQLLGCLTDMTHRTCLPNNDTLPFTRSKYRGRCFVSRLGHRGAPACDI